jgi:hypothetical protein
VQLSDCFATSIEALFAPVSCSKLSGSPIRKLKYCRCVFGNGGTDCHTLTRPALQRAVLCLLLLPIVIYVLRFAIREMRARQLPKLKGLLPLDIVVGLSALGAGFDVINLVQQVVIVFATFDMTHLTTWHWLVAQPVVSVCPLVTISVLMLSWWNILKRSFGSAAGAPKFKWCLNAKHTTMLCIFIIVAQCVMWLSLGLLQIYSLVGAAIYIFFTYAIHKIANKFVGYLKSVGHAFESTPGATKRLTLKQWCLTRHLWCFSKSRGSKGENAAAAVTPTHGSGATSGGGQYASTSVPGGGNSRKSGNNDLAYSIGITIHATTDVKRGMLIVVFGAAMFGLATMVLGRTASETGWDADGIGMLFLQLGYMKMYLGCVLYAERVRTCVVRKTPGIRSWISRSKRRSNSSKGGRSGKRHTDDNACERSAGEANVEAAGISHYGASSAAGSITTSATAGDVECVVEGVDAEQGAIVES